MLSDAGARALTDRFAAVTYTVDAVVELIGEAAHGALARNSTVPAVRAIADRRDPLATLTLLWPLQRSVPSAAVQSALPGLVEPLLAAGILERDLDDIRATIDIRPYGSDDGAAGWVAADPTPGLDTAVTPMRPDFVLGVSSASSTLAQLTVRRPVARALDLGSGCGVQSLHLARHAEQVVATDLNPRAVALTRLTAALNSIDLDVRQGDLYEPVAEERFDLIVSNPPYVMSPPGPDAARLTYREGNLVADGLVERVVRHGVAHLGDGGMLQVLGNWAHLRGQPWSERLAAWTATPGIDVHVVQREVLDPSAYVELWLADAGLAGAPDYRERYATWLDYFDQLDIEAVGMGWLVIHRSGAQQPRQVFEDWPHAVEQPIGPAFAAEQAAMADLRTRDDAELLATRWRIADDIVEETQGRPGAADPQHLVHRQQRRFRRARALDTATAATLGACDGDLTLAQIIGPVAELLDLDPSALSRAMLDRWRDLVVDGFATPVVE